MNQDLDHHGFCWIAIRRAVVYPPPGQRTTTPLRRGMNPRPAVFRQSNPAEEEG